MNKNQTTQLSTNNHDLLVDALRILQELVSAVENDVFTDAPERALSVTDAEAAIRQAHQVFRTLERAANGEWPAPQAIPDFLMWIQDEWEIQDRLVADSPKDSDLVYASALLDLVEELRALGFEPSPAPWQLSLQNAQLEMG